MRKFKRVLTEEEKKITASLNEEISRLEPVVQPLIAHVVKAGGKRIRPLVLVLMARAFGCTGPDVYSLASAIELLHGATLMHDDVVDGAELRRGSPAAHAVFGASRTILAGDVLLASCMRIVLRSRRLDIMDCMAMAVEKTAAGEVEEINNLRNPNLDYAGYLHIITGKTAWLIRCACEVGALQAGATEEQVQAAATFGLELGIAFQLVDDALDIAPEKATGKPTGGDLREGKVTPLIKFYMESLGEKERKEFMDGFTKATFREPEIQNIAKRMRELKCDESTRILADQHLRKAEEAMSVIPKGQEYDIMLAMVNYIRNRDH